LNVSFIDTSPTPVTQLLCQESLGIFDRETKRLR